MAHHGITTVLFQQLHRNIWCLSGFCPQRICGEVRGVHEDCYTNKGILVIVENISCEHKVFHIYNEIPESQEAVGNSTCRIASHVEFNAVFRKAVASSAALWSALYASSPKRFATVFLQRAGELVSTVL